MSTTFFTSQRNSMKQDDSTSSVSLGPPKTSAYSGTLFVTNFTIPHNLGYPPVFSYKYEPFGDGIIWGSLSSRIEGRARNPNNILQFGPGILAWVDNMNMYIQLYYLSNALTASYPVYWTIYRDFSL